jgi:hypothetical protein
MLYAFQPPPSTVARNACAKFSRHTAKDCPRPYRVSKECVCDLRRLAASASDWEIAILVGAATYGQLLDAGPGLFEPFSDFRSDGGGAASIASVCFQKTCHRRGGVLVAADTPLPRDVLSPPPPNLVSTLLADGALTIGDLKRLLVRAASGRGVSPLIEPLVASSVSYRHPELTLGEIVGTFVWFAVIAAIVLACCIQSVRTARTCTGGEGEWC